MLVPQEPSRGPKPMLRDLNRDSPGARLDLSNSVETPVGVRRLGAWTVAGDLPSSFRYAAQGLIYSFRSQRNFRIHVVTGGVVFALGLWLQLPLGQLAVLVLTDHLLRQRATAGAGH